MALFNSNILLKNAKMKQTATKQFLFNGIFFYDPLLVGRILSSLQKSHFRCERENKKSLTLRVMILHNSVIGRCKREAKKLLVWKSANQTWLKGFCILTPIARFEWTWIENQSNRWTFRVKAQTFFLFGAYLKTSFR